MWSHLSAACGQYYPGTTLPRAVKELICASKTYELNLLPHHRASSGRLGVLLLSRQKCRSLLHAASCCAHEVHERLVLRVPLGPVTLCLL